MNRFETISPSEIDRILDRIGKDWMLISASDGTRTNTMTASWGCMGVLWNKPVAVCFIRPQRYTYEIVESTDRLTLSFFDGQRTRRRQIQKLRLDLHPHRKRDSISRGSISCARLPQALRGRSEKKLVC